MYYAMAPSDQANNCEHFELNVTLSEGKHVNVWHSVVLPSFGGTEQPQVFFYG